MGIMSSTTDLHRNHQPFYFPKPLADKILNEQILPKCKDRFVVLAGCGGGCDVYGTALLYKQAIRAGAKKVILVNLSFTSTFNLNRNAKCVLERDLCFKVEPGVDMGNADNFDGFSVKDDSTYFPEAMLANAIGHPVYAFRGGYMTVKDIAESHRAMLKEEGFFDEANVESRGAGAVLFLTDGGCDAFLTGMETGLATPVEDMMHLRAITKYLMKSGAVAFSLPAKLVEAGHKLAPDVEDAVVVAENIYDPKCAFLCAIGANVDVGHGVIESELVDRLVDLQKSGILLASKTLDVSTTTATKKAASAGDSDSESSIVPDPEAVFFCEVVKKCKPVQTIVQSLAVAAMEGHRGFYTPEHLVSRIGRNKIPLSELTSTFFVLDLVRVAGEVIYLNQIRGAHNSTAFVATLHKILKSYGK